jgi:thermitase
MVQGAPSDQPFLSKLSQSLSGVPTINTTEKSYTTIGTASSSSVLVKFKAGANQTQAHAKVGGKVKRQINRIGAHMVETTKPVGETLAEYRGRTDVEYAEPNYVSRAFYTPNDSEYSKQWGLAKVAAPVAWDVRKAFYGKIAVIDTGIDLTHTDLKSQLSAGYNFVAGTASAHDDNGHGTHVAGIIGATSDNGTGTASIGFRGALMPVKVLDASGAGNYGDVAAGIVFAADNGATIINLSLGGSSSSRTLQDAINYALGKGIIVVAAAGNNGTSAAVYPAAYPGVLAVSASTSSDGLASFSSYGSAVKVAAPGVSIVSTYKGGGYASLSGTSMAAPFVAGLLGLAQSANPAPGAVVAALKSTADKVGPHPYDTSGWNQYFGYGRINAGRLLTSLGVPTVTPSPSPSASPSASPVKKKNPRAHQFDVNLDGTVDHVADGYVVVKIKSGNDALGVPAGSLVNLYTSTSTVLKSGSQTLAATGLGAGDRITAKATWINTKLTAESITITSKSTSSGSTTTNTTAPVRGRKN